MLEVVTAAGLVLAGSTACGSAIWRLSRLPSGSTVAPAVGFAALLAVGALTIRLPGRGTLCAVVLAVTVLASLGYLSAGRSGGLLPWWAVGTAVVVVLLALVPFAVSARTGVLGVGTNDDMAEHLLAAWTLQGPLPLSANKLLVSGYPIGPHALAGAIAQGTGMPLEDAFVGLIIAVPALLALAAAALLDVGRRGLRIAVACAVGLCYLQAAYLVQASFKEPMEAVILVAFTAGMYELERHRSRTKWSAVPLGVLAGGAVYIYSYGGVLWPAGAMVAWAATRFAAVGARRTPIVVRARPWVPVFAIGTAAFLVVAAPDVPRMIAFAGSGYNREGPSVFGDLLRALPAQEALGIWPRLDFRFDVPLASVGGILGLGALGAVLACLVASARRQDFAVPSALIAAAALYGLSATRSPYIAAKALVILAPLVTLLLGRELLVVLRASRSSGSGRALTVAVFGVLLAAGGYSDLEVLRDGPVGPENHAQQLAGLRVMIGQHPTLFLGADDFVHWELRGANLATPPEPLYTRLVVPLRRAKARQSSALYATPHAIATTNRLAGLGLAFDFDSVPSGVLDRFAFAILPRSAYASAPPGNWHLVSSTKSYELWRRAGPTPSRQTLTEIDSPGAVLDCTTTSGRRIAGLPGVAMISSLPVAGQRDLWRGAVGYAGKSAHQTLDLGRGAWAISLQYDSTVEVRVSGPGLRAVLPANLEPLGPYWFAGEVHVTRPGRVKVVVTYGSLTLLGRIVGAFGLTRAPAPTGLSALGRIAATRVPFAEHLVPLRAACGRYVDWYRTA